MTDPINELVLAAKAAVEWMEDATLPNELNPVLRRLQETVELVEDQSRKDGSNAQTAVQ